MIQFLFFKTHEPVSPAASHNNTQVFVVVFNCYVSILWPSSGCDGYRRKRCNNFIKKTDYCCVKQLGKWVNNLEEHIHVDIGIILITLCNHVRTSLCIDKTSIIGTSMCGKIKLLSTLAVYMKWKVNSILGKLEGSYR